MTRSVFIRRTLVLVMFLAALTAWVFLGATFIFELDRPWRIGAVIVAAIATEGFMWTAAGMLGWKVFESRNAIWRSLTAGTK